MLVNHQSPKALLAITWHFAEKGSGLAYLRCFGEHFGVPPKKVALPIHRHGNGKMHPEDILWAVFNETESSRTCWSPFLWLFANNLLRMYLGIRLEK